MDRHWHVQIHRTTGERYTVKRWPFVPAHLAQALITWGEEHGRTFPWRQKVDPFALLVAEMLLRRTRASHVAKIYDALLLAHPTPAAMAAADIEQLRASVRPLGMANLRAEGLQGMARALVADHQGTVPVNPAALARIPHVGPYTANAVGCFGMGLPLPVVDSNVIRVFDRFTGTKTVGANPHREKSIWGKTERSLPATGVAAYNYALLDLGALVCTAGSPACEKCPLATGCATVHQRQVNHRCS